MVNQVGAADIVVVVGEGNEAKGNDADEFVAMTWLQGSFGYAQVSTHLR